MEAITETTGSARSRRIGQLTAQLIAGVAIALTGLFSAAVGTASPALAEDCDNVVDTTGSFSMNCAPAPMGDTNGAPVQAPSINDFNLTEAEVSEPGWGGGGIPR